MRFGATLVASLLALGVASPTLDAQAPTSSPAFEVVSIKPIAGDPNGSGWGLQPGGHFRASSVTVRNLISTAFYNPGPPAVSFPPDRILGGPAWLGTDHFNIEARTNAELAARSPLMGTPLGNALIRSLLEDRFKLQTHMEARDFTVFALTPVRADGTLGPNLKRSTFDCAAFLRGRPALPPQQPPSVGRTGLISAPCVTLGGAGFVQGVAIPWAMVTGGIRQGLGGAEVVDQTGITGRVDVDFHFTVEQQDGLVVNPTAPSLLTAVKEQLGLKLESRKEPRPVIVIDHVEKPSED